MPTMKDVALLANVAVGTVSRVVNKQMHVSEKTRKKVERAIKELNYQPNNYARALKLNKTNTIALIVPTVWHPFFSEFTYHVETTLEKKGYKTLICNSEANQTKELEYITMVKQNKVDGIIAITYSDVDKYISSELPFVSIDRHFSDEVVSVTADNAKAGIIAANTLIENGCKNLAFIGGYSEYSNETNNRKKYFVKEANKNNIDPLILNMAEPIENARSEIKIFLKRNPKIDGIFTINDFMALDTIKVLEELKVNIPTQVQIIGCDGLKIARGHDNILSTIQQPIEKMAVESVKSLLNIIHNEPVKLMKVLPVKFVKGRTTK